MSIIGSYNADMNAAYASSEDAQNERLIETVGSLPLVLHSFYQSFILEIIIVFIILTVN